MKKFAAPANQRASQLASKVEAAQQQLGTTTDPAIPPAPQGPSPQEFAKAVDQKSAELTAAEKTRDETQAAYAADADKLTKLDARIVEGHNAGQQRDSLLAEPRPSAKRNSTTQITTR